MGQKVSGGSQVEEMAKRGRGRLPSYPEEAAALVGQASVWPAKEVRSFPARSVEEAVLMGRRLRYLGDRLGYRVSCERHVGEDGAIEVRFWIDGRTLRRRVGNR